MRNIDWDAVKQRRREENAIGVGSVGSRRAVDEALAQAGEARAEALAAQSRGPAFREVNGQIVLIQEAAVIDREADADREIELMEEVEEDDLTNRITSASFLREDKRFPKEFLLPGQGKKWTTEGTEAFYDALQMFGTDFMMISTLFPGTTRRSIKTKFNREERENPRRIKDALNGQRNSNWAEYLTRSGMEDDAFVDPTAIENELQEERERMRVSIEAAKQAKAEEDRQKDLAGVLREENEGEKENEDGRRRRKRKEKPKTVSFEAEEGVEILPLDDE
jgi:transcription factor TFIIIB component B''